MHGGRDPQEKSIANNKREGQEGASRTSSEGVW